MSVLVSHRMTLHHWFIFNGKSRWLCTHLANIEYIIVSDVGLSASFSESSSFPPWVTHATSGTNPSKCWDSFFRNDSGMNIGKYAFCTPSACIFLFISSWYFSQIA